MGDEGKRQVKTNNNQQIFFYFLYSCRGLAVEDATNFVFSRKTGRMSFGHFNPEIEVWKFES